MVEDRCALAPRRDRGRTERQTDRQTDRYVILISYLRAYKGFRPSFPGHPGWPGGEAMGRPLVGDLAAFSWVGVGHLMRVGIVSCR